ncbi:TetR/AcrR family transcriptional regulator [Cellulomonas fengjieae]|uniref:TetR family transcriptional regulator n=1 Tax=Cellulomonas fengjieae TaxID=2819978 RepID=A0ABS3SFX2_9CELL|nr:TetR/AcrR family transcriptional regulator [Cellulomonas fengjieae]MBO3084657.1 TetR family transcriptional regulator [Cellulomonas fengjieae]MBO3103429.1 TetR family transcriptional regulator [Cellulomonas fengjieae]QVI67019.1 TetR family transcriptional regulator [Cellulomonas fengjieae]
MEGRRDRKKRQTGERIRASALELFAQHGYRQTTIAAIAEHADVATRTVTLHFPTKADLLFAGDPFAPESLAARLADRTGDTLDAFGEWLHDTIRDLGEYDEDLGRPPGEMLSLHAMRPALIAEDPDLASRAHVFYSELERVTAESLAQELGTSADGLAPRLTAYTLVGGLRELYRVDEASRDTLPALVDRVLAFARAGLHTLTT